MSFTVGGSTPQLTFADATVQNTAALPLTGGSVSADITVNGLTVGRGAGAVATNTAMGASALAGNTSGASNTSLGYQSLNSNTTSSNNTAVGYQAAYSNTTGQPLISIGYQSLYANTTGVQNVAVGNIALTQNTTGGYNTAIGHQSLYGNTTASNNTAVGYQAGYSTTTSGSNTFLGYLAGYTNTTGTKNTLVGANAGYSLTTGSSNTFVGPLNSTSALASGSLITTGFNNTIIGAYNGNNGGLDIRTANNYIVLSDGDGNPRGVFDSNGKFLVGLTASGSGAIIQAANASGTEPVIQVSNTSTGNQGCFVSSLNTGAGTTSSYHFKGTSSGVGTWYLYGNGTSSFTSDIRRKKNIELAQNGYMDNLIKLEVVSYQWKANSDTSEKQLGLIAQQVEPIFPELVQDDFEPAEDGITYKSLKTSALPFMLLKAIQEQQAIITSQAADIATLKAKVGI